MNLILNWELILNAISQLHKHKYLDALRWYQVEFVEWWLGAGEEKCAVIISGPVVISCLCS